MNHLCKRFFNLVDFSFAIKILILYIIDYIKYAKDTLDILGRHYTLSVYIKCAQSTLDMFTLYNDRFHMSYILSTY